MDQDFNRDEFEHFIKHKADQYQIYPSERVWRGVFSFNQSKGKAFKIGAGLLFITGLLFTTQALIFSGTSDKNIKAKPAVATITNTSAEGTARQAIAPGDVVPHTPELSDTHKALAVTNPLNETALPKKNSTIFSSAESVGSQQVVSPDKDVNYTAIGFDKITNAPEPINITPGISLPDLTNTVSESDAPTSLTEEENETYQPETNWLQEMAAIKLTPVKKSPFNLQFYFSPTISYRRLAENKTNLHANQQNIPVASYHNNVDRYVDHKPSIGVELGSNVIFAATKNLMFKTGLQLNYSRYNIKAYKFYFEKASIALNTVGHVADTITAYTSIRNFSGYSPEQLQNQYLQISVPIGAELKLLGNKRLQLNVAGTVQPTYLLFNDIYLLSTDYINYAKEPSLIRKWNLHTSAEAFVSYKVGSIRWQVGPQFRYQVKSSYNDRYPIKEHLIEYGLKLGISKTLK